MREEVQTQDGPYDRFAISKLTNTIQTLYIVNYSDSESAGHHFVFRFFMKKIKLIHNKYVIKIIFIINSTVFFLLNDFNCIKLKYKMRCHRGALIPDSRD